MMWRSRDARRREEALVVALAERLCEVAATVEPRDEFRASLRTSLVMEASTAIGQVDPPSVAPVAEPARVLRRRMAVATTIIATTLGLGGMASASASALPGEALYPVKRATEQIELAFQRGNEERGAFQLELAERRLTEADELPERGPEYGELATESVREFGDEAEAGTKDLVAAFREDDSRAGMVLLNGFAVRADTLLTTLETKLPAQAAAALADARARLNAMISVSARLCPDCAGGPTDLASAQDGSDGAAASPAQPPQPPAPAPAAPAAPPAPSTGSSSASENEDDEDEDEDEDEDVKLPDLSPVVPSPPGTDLRSAKQPAEPPAVPTPTAAPTPTPPPPPEPHECRIGLPGLGFTDPVIDGVCDVFGGMHFGHDKD